MYRSALPLTIAWNQMIAGAVLLPSALAVVAATYALRSLQNLAAPAASSAPQARRTDNL